MLCDFIHLAQLYIFYLVPCDSFICDICSRSHELVIIPCFIYYSLWIFFQQIT